MIKIYLQLMKYKPKHIFHFKKLPDCILQSRITYHKKIITDIFSLLKKLKK